MLTIQPVLLGFCYSVFLGHFPIETWIFISMISLPVVLIFVPLLREKSHTLNNLSSSSSAQQPFLRQGLPQKLLPDVPISDGPAIASLDFVTIFFFRSRSLALRPTPSNPGGPIGLLRCLGLHHGPVWHGRPYQ
jgi:hypothetical protein